MKARPWLRYGVPVFILAAVAAIVWLAPEEKTLGPGIKSVYVHVALTWTGMTGLTIAGLLGIGAAITNGGRLSRWAQMAGWVAIGFFGAGLAMSMIAAKVNWGGVFWAEPRAQAAMRIVAFALIVQILCTWLRSVRLSGVLHVFATLFMLWTIFQAELVLHPRSPILTSESRSIQLTFASLFVLVAAGAGWTAWHFLGRRRKA